MSKSIKPYQDSEKGKKEQVAQMFDTISENYDGLNKIISLIKKYNIIKECYQKAQHYINLASNSLTIFKDSKEKEILKSLTSFSLARNF